MVCTCDKDGLRSLFDTFILQNSKEVGLHANLPKKDCQVACLLLKSTFVYIAIFTSFLTDFHWISHLILNFWVS